MYIQKLKMEEKEIVDIEDGSDVATSQRLPAVKRIWKRAGTDSLLQLLDRACPCRLLGFGLSRDRFPAP